MKSAKINTEKMKKVVEDLYIKELLGVEVYNNINLCPQIIPLIDQLRTNLFAMLVYALDNSIGYYEQFESVNVIVQEIEAELSALPNWKSSELLKIIL